MENNLERSERHERESAEYANRLTRINSSKFTRSDIQTAHFIGAANEYVKVKQQARAEVLEEVRLEVEKQAIDGVFESNKQDANHFRDWIGKTISLSDFKNILTKLSEETK